MNDSNSFAKNNYEFCHNKYKIDYTLNKNKQFVRAEVSIKKVLLIHNRTFC